MSTNNNAVINKHRQGMAGIRKHFANLATIPLGGTPTAPADAIATLQGSIDAIDAAAAAQQAFHAAVTSQKAAVAKGKTTLGQLKTLTLVQTQLGTSDAVLGDFGFTNPKRQVPNQQTKAAAVVKRAATRAARHTMGPRQKDTIKGNVTGVAVTPVTSSTSAAIATPQGSASAVPAAPQGSATSAPAAASSSPGGATPSHS